MAGFEGAVDETGGGGEVDGWLGNIVPRLGKNPRTKFVSLFLSAVRTDQHSIATRFSDGFHDILI
jgi:hypothetical protein